MRSQPIFFQALRGIYRNRFTTYWFRAVVVTMWSGEVTMGCISNLRKPKCSKLATRPYARTPSRPAMKHQHSSLACKELGQGHGYAIETSFISDSGLQIPCISYMERAAPDRTPTVTCMRLRRRSADDTVYQNKFESDVTQPVGSGSEHECCAVFLLGAKNF